MRKVGDRKINIIKNTLDKVHRELKNSIIQKSTKITNVENGKCVQKLVLNSDYCTWDNSKFRNVFFSASPKNHCKKQNNKQTKHHKE